MPDGRGTSSDGDQSVQPHVPGRAPLDKDRIVSAALGFIQDHSIRELTMRRLGAQLGVEAMALYRYVPSRDDLLDAIVDLILDEMYQDPDVLLEPRYGWQDFLQRLAHGVRRTAIAHPAAFPLIVSRPPEAPWLRPPLRSLQWVEIFLNGLAQEGFDDREVIETYRAFTSFLLGHLLLDAAIQGVEMGPLSDYDNTNDAEQSPTSYPQIQRLQHGLAEDHSEREFEEALESLLERIASTLPG